MCVFFVKISDNSVKTAWIFRIVKDFYEKIYFTFLVQAGCII